MALSLLERHDLAFELAGGGASAPWLARIEADEDTHRVFAQVPSAAGPTAQPRVPWGEAKAHAARFFELRLGLSIEHDGLPPLVLVALAPAEGRGAECIVIARAATADDRALATAADTTEGASGFAALVHRCPWLWLVCPVDSAVRDAGEPFPWALRTAAVLAGVGLGPILCPGAKLIGPKTARLRSEP